MPKIEVESKIVTDESREVALAEAKRLLSQAESYLREPDIAPAVWRLVDAAGLIAGHSGPDELIGRDDPTGRGFRIVRVSTPVSVCPDCGEENSYGPDMEGFYDCRKCGAGWKPDART